MSLNKTLIQRLETSRAEMLKHLDEIDKNRKVYPLWTVREILAHLSGWDDAVIGFIRAIIADEIPPTPAARGINVYNAETVATREGLDYDRVYREYIETRKTLIELLRQVPEEKITRQYVLPWGDMGSLEQIIRVFEHHEREEHAEDVRKLVEEARK